MTRPPPALVALVVLPAARKAELPIAFSDLRSGENSFEIAAPTPRPWKRIRIHNHGAFHAWFPTIGVLRVRGPLLREAHSLAGLGLWNLAASDKVLFGQWSMVSLVLAYLLLAGSWCSWRNLRVERWDGLDETSRARFAEARHAVLLFLAIFAVYNSNAARVGTTDTIAPPRWPSACSARGTWAWESIFTHTGTVAAGWD